MGNRILVTCMASRQYDFESGDTFGISFYRDKTSIRINANNNVLSIYLTVIM